MKILTLTVSLFMLACGSPLAQISAPLDVMATTPVLEADVGTHLVGSNPSAVIHGFVAEPGALVQIIQVGPNGHPDAPNADGSPGGDDAVFASTSIGVGIVPNDLRSGRFAASFYPPPLDGTLLFARIFDGVDIASANFWTQSGTFEVVATRVMDISALGAVATMQPIDQVATEDADGDGLSNQAELMANTHPLDGSDRFEAQGEVNSQQVIRVKGEAGRRYCLERCTSLTEGAMIWEDVAQTPILSSRGLVDLVDPTPGEVKTVYYRLRVEFP
ncbi:MAG: hypothetical protein ACI97B_003805 [Verrucomicrobiales bacterium]|jgi:hypothetical protein